MKHKFLYKNNSNSAILFFNGWGCDEKPFSFIESGSSDVLMLYDYSELDLRREVINEIKSYKYLYVVAWSFGVWVAQYFAEKHDLSISKAVAYNGTLKPVHKNKGIPEVIAKLTLDQFSESSLQKFRLRMVGEENIQNFNDNLPDRDIENIHVELESLYNHFKGVELEGNIFNKVVLGKNDLIFLFENQQRFWRGKTEIKEVDELHFCFYRYKKWYELVQA